MKIKDRIYGEIELQPKVIENLVKSKPFQRLKGISQDGVSHFIQPVRNVTRFEHSVGVWYLSHRYKRPLEEQVASLLHDIPHTAFSHVVDFVVNNEKHEFHEQFAEEIIMKSEIPDILKKHGIDPHHILEKDNFYLLENNLPDISTDRWDYFMRDGYTVGFLPKELIDIFLNNIQIKNERFVFTDCRIASTFAILFASFSRLIWLDPTSHGAFHLMTEAIRKGMQLNLIAQDDFFTDDDSLLKKLKETKNPEINNFLDRLKPGKEFIYADKQLAEFYGPNKPRYVDPLVETKNGVERLTSLVPSLGYFFQEFASNYKCIGVNQLI